jgi:hypothetical protein
MKTSFIQKEFRGLYTLRRANSIPTGFSAHSLNSDLSSSTQVGGMKGYSLFGHNDNTTDKITGQFTYERGFGLQSLLQIRDNASNSILELLIPDDNRNSSKGEWMQLVANFTTGKKMSFAPFNDSGTDNLLMSNGADNFSRWGGGVCKLATATVGAEATITVSKLTADPKTNATDGFGSTGTLVVRADDGTRTAITYTGKTADTFTGCTGTPAMSVNTGIAEAVDTSTYSAVGKYACIITAQGRVWGGGKSTAPTLLEYSAVGDFTSWSAGVNPDDPGNADFPDGGNIKALGSMDDWILIFKDDKVLGYALTYPSSTTRVSVRKFISGVGISNLYGLDLVGNDYIYVSPEGQIRQMSRVSAENIFTTVDLGHIIRPSIKDFVFTDAIIKYWRKERILMIACKKDNDSTENDRVIALQFSEDIEGNPIANIGIMDWWIGGMAIYNDELYFGNSGESKCFKAFDGYDKDGSPITWEYTTKIEDFGDEFMREKVDGLWIKGKIGAGTTLSIYSYLDDGGQTQTFTDEVKYVAETTGEILDIDNKIIITGITNPLGANALGTEPLGGTIAELDDLDYFGVFFPYPQNANPQNIQLMFTTSGQGQRVVIYAYGFRSVEDAKMLPFPKK